MERMSVFLRAENEKGYIQAVIQAVDYPSFQALGFVDSVDKVEQREKPKKSNKKDKVADDAGKPN